MRHSVGCGHGEARRPRDRAGRRRGQAADAADRRPGQAGGPVRRAVPPGRLRAVQPGQRRLPADLRADAVQVALAGPAHHHDLADVHPARQLRHPGAGPAAARARAGTTAAPTRSSRASTSSTTSGPTTSSSSAPTTSTGWTRRRWSRSTSSPAPAVTVAGIRVPRSQADQFGVIETGAQRQGHRAVPREADRPARAARQPRRGATPRWATTSSRTDALIEALRIDAGDEGSVHDMGGNIIPMLVKAGRGQGLRLRRQRRARLDRPRPRLLARRRDPRRLPRRAHGPGVGPPDLQPLQPAVADPHQPAVAAAGEVRRGRRRPRVDRRRRDDRLRRARRRRPCSATTSASGRARTSRARCSCPASHVGRGAVVRRAILDKNVIVPDGARIGVDLERDRELYTVSTGGVVALGKGVTAVI